ncbi:MAG: tetratricopeptide repeat protein [Anaerolineae bacterium]
MANQQVNRVGARDFDGVTPPPRILLWGAVGLFLLLIVGATVGFIILKARPSMSELLGVAVIAAPIFTVGSVVVAAALRNYLPRHSVTIIVIGWVLLWLVVSGAFIAMFRNTLPPGQRETVKHYLPFMTIFDPPLPPSDSSLPTPAPNETSNISADDLLNAPLGITSPQSEPPPAVVQPAATATPEVLPTSPPTAEPTAAFTATPAPTQVAVVPVSNSEQINRPLFAQLGGITPVKQGWNNCGPANITMALSYYGWTQTQDYALKFLKPDREDKNVNPWELVAFVNEQSQVRSLYRVGGDMELIKRLLANKLPVLIETGYMYEGSDWLGHYQTVVGFDDSQRIFYVYDSYLGTGENGNGMPKSYDDFDSFWENFNRTFIVLYRPEEEILVRDILGERADETRSYELAAETARTEARANPRNAFAWFNLGSSLTKLGQYEQAAAAFDKARQVGTHWRMTLYQFGPFEAYFNVGRYDDVLSLVEANLNNGGQYIEESYYWQGKVLAAKGDNAKATAAFKQALVHNPRYADAQNALSALPK